MERQTIQVKRGRPQKPKVEVEKPKIEVEKVMAQRGRPPKPKPEVEPTPAVENTSQVIDKPERPKKPSLYRDDPKAYFRAYYHNRPKVESTCEHCGNKFNSMLSLRLHMRTSVLCKKLREVNHLNEID